MDAQRRASWAAIIVFLALFLPACSAGSTGTTGGGGQDSERLTVALTGEPDNLDFTTTSGSAIPQALMGNVYEGLVKIGQDGGIEPLLATSWDLSDDRRTYTFHLREGVTFSNGSPFNADAVKFSIEQVQSDAWENGLKAKMDVVESVTAVDDTTVEVVLTKPSNAWLWDMGTLVGTMFTPDGADDLPASPIGTGPYTVQEWAKGDHLTLAARDGYWGEKPKTETVVLRYFSDAVATTNALSSGDVDVVQNLQAPELLQSFEANDEYRVIAGSSPGKVMLPMNNRVAPFDDPKVRQAVMYALDRKAIVDTAWAGYGTPAVAPVAETDPYHENLDDMYPHDVAKAKKLLAEAGHPDGIDITLTVPTRPYATSVSEIVVSQLAEAGIRATIETAEFPAVWLRDVFKNHDYEMSVILHTEARDVLTIYNDPDYYVGYDNSKIAPLAAEADAGSEQEYTDTMKQVVRIIEEDAASANLFMFPNIVVSRATVSGIPENAVTEAFEVATIAKEE